MVVANHCVPKSEIYEKTGKMYPNEYDQNSKTKL